MREYDTLAPKSRKYNFKEWGLSVIFIRKSFKVGIADTKYLSNWLKVTKVYVTTDICLNFVKNDIAFSFFEDKTEQERKD